ncbi:hypothetical protein [Escherichia coli]|uniref:hypothetical protein n=1 Tax=Escherichia coli TaxID=562 RepID=UPI003CFC1F20
MPFDSNDDRQCDSPADWRSPDRMSIANCAIGPLYDEQIKKTLMYADHKFKRLMNTRMSLLEHLSPHYDLSSMFSYELEGRVFRIKLIKPEIKLSRQQLIFSSLFLEQDFLKEYKKHISNTLQKTIKQCIKKYKQKIKVEHSILDYISASSRNTSSYVLHEIVSQCEHCDEIRNIKNDILLDELTLNGRITNISKYIKNSQDKIVEHIEFCTHKFVNISRKNRHIFNTTTISGRKPNITGVLLCLSELISNLHIYPTAINNISNAIILSIVYSVLQHLQSGRETEKTKTSPALDFIPTIIAPHVFYLAKREKSSQYKYIEKEYLLGQLLIFLMYKTVYYSIHSIRVSRKHFYNDIKPKLMALKKESLLSTNFMKNRSEIRGEVFGDVGSIEADLREISTLIHRRKALFISF